MFYICFLIGLSFVLIKDRNSFFYKLFIIFIVLLSIARYGSGPDYFAYRYLFSNLSDSFLLEIMNPLYNQELLYRLSGVLFKKMGANYQFYIGVLSIINIFFVSRLIRKNSTHPRMSMFLFYSFFYLVWVLGALRQGLALSIGMFYFIEYSRSKKHFRFFFIACVLCFVHSATFILVPIYFLINRIALNKRTLFITTIFSFFCSMLPIGLILSKLTFLPILNKVGFYLNSSYSFISAFNIQSIARLFFLAVVFIYYEQVTKKYEALELITKIYIIFANIYFFLKGSEVLAGRISIFGFFLLIIILPAIYTSYTTFYNKVIFFLFISILSIFFLQKDLQDMQMRTLYNSKRIIVPYTNIFNKENYVFTKENYYKLNDDTE